MIVRGLLAFALFVYSTLNILASLSRAAGLGPIARFLMYGVLVEPYPGVLTSALCVILAAPLLVGSLGLAWNGRWAIATIKFTAGGSLAALILGALVAGLNAFLGYSYFPYLVLVTAAPAALPLVVILVGTASVGSAASAPATRPHGKDWTRIDTRAWFVLFTASMLSGPIYYVVVGMASSVVTRSNTHLLGVLMLVQFVLYVLTVSLLQKWYFVLTMVLLFPLVAGSVFIAALLVACSFYRDCI